MVIIEKVDKYLVERAIEEDKEYEKTAFSPTDAYQCPRKIFYRWHKYDKINTDARSCRVFSLGDAIHERWQKLLNDMGIQLKDEVRIEDYYKGMPIHGYVDSICIIDNQPYIVEFKSNKEWLYKYNNKEVDYLQEPKKEHVGQVQLYMHFTGIHNAIILYENKNTSEIREFIIKYDETEAKNILEGFLSTYEKISLNELPERLEKANKNKYPCAWCEFREICFNKDNQKPESSNKTL